MLRRAASEYHGNLSFHISRFLSFSDLRRIGQLIPDLAAVPVEDLLPAGLEIEDERLLTRFTTPKREFDDPRKELEAKLLEKRFDRLLWFGDFDGSTKEHVITYQVRAVTPGVFQIPPAQVEAMYRPQLKGITYPETPTLAIEE